MTNLKREKLTISQVVPPATDAVIAYVPADGESITIDRFKGTGNESTLSEVRLYWDYDGAGEELLWVIAGETPMPDEIFFTRVGDGIKELAVVLSNGDAALSFAMAGHGECEKAV